MRFNKLVLTLSIAAQRYSSGHPARNCTVTVAATISLSSGLVSVADTRVTTGEIVATDSQCTPTRAEATRLVCGVYTVSVGTIVLSISTCKLVVLEFSITLAASDSAVQCRIVEQYDVSVGRLDSPSSVEFESTNNELRRRLCCHHVVKSDRPRHIDIVD